MSQARAAVLERPAYSGSSIPSDPEMLIARLLFALGEDPERQGLASTPRRVWSCLSELTDGYDREAADVIGDAEFDEEYGDMVLVQNIEFYSLCEHHLLPFFGCAHLAYVPDGRIVGLSKIPRVIDMFAHRLQVQERLTMQVADAVEDVLRPRGVAVVLEASHLCMMMRGVQKQHSQTVTYAMRGIFNDDLRVRAEFLEQVKKS